MIRSCSEGVPCGGLEAEWVSLLCTGHGSEFNSMPLANGCAAVYVNDVSPCLCVTWMTSLIVAIRTIVPPVPFRDLIVNGIVKQENTHTITFLPDFGGNWNVVR